MRDIVLPPDLNLPASAAEAESMYGLPKGLLQGLESAEGSGSTARSPKGAFGRMQFMPETWKQYGKGRDPSNDPAQYDAAARYMVDLGKQYDGDWGAATAHYNGGGRAGNAVAAGGQPPSPETRAYLPKVAAKRQIELPEGMGALAKGNLPERPITLPPPPAGATVGQIAQHTADEKTSSIKAFAKSAAEGLIPSAGGAAAFGAGAAAGAAAAAPLAALSGPFAPVVEAVGAIGGGAAAAMGASYAVREMQNYALSFVPESVLKQFGMDKDTRTKEELAHPWASMAGTTAANLPFFRPGMISLKQAASMAGMGAGFEAGREYYYGEPLDPVKMAIAGGGQALSAKPTKLGQALAPSMRPPEGTAKPATPTPSMPAGKPRIILKAQPDPVTSSAYSELNPPLSSIAPRGEYIKQVQDALGPGWSKQAVEYWNQMASKFGKGGPLPTRAPVGAVVQRLGDDLYTLQQNRQADKIEAKKIVSSMTPQEYALASGEDMYHSLATERDANVPLSPEMQAVKSRFIAPLQKTLDREWKALQAVSPQDAELFDPYNPRTVDQTWLTKVARRMGGDPFGASSTLARRAGSMNERSMMALEYADGSRRVVRRNGTDFEGYDPAKKNIGSVAQTPEYAKVGDSFTDSTGAKVKLVQASTAEIESATDLRYNKNAIANLTETIAEIRSYRRERAFLDNTMQGLQKIRAAIPVSKVPTAPPGFKRLDGDPTLSKYYIQERFAEPFQDTILHRGEGPMLSAANNLAVGSMFWNPEPHLFNAFDHWYSNMGWDLLKPWQYKSIAKSVFDAYRDVSTVSPDYLKMVRSGAGLQYARIAAEDTMQTVMKGIGKKGWDEIAVSWGMKPAELVGAIYDKSKHILWGGSDVMMMSAYRHAASKEGVDILNQAIRNHVEAHNPNYRVPARVGFDEMMKIPGMPEVFAKVMSRGFSLLMQNRIFNMFGRYHFGQMKSLGHDIKDLVVQNPSSVQSRGEALGHLAFVAFNVGVVYPFLWDGLAKMVSGNEDSMMRRSGASTIPYTIYHLLMGDQEFGKLITEAYNLPPVTKAAAELPANRTLFTGKHIWEPGDYLASQLDDVRQYLTGTFASPMRLYQDATKDGANIQEVMAKQFGIKTKQDTLTDDQLERMSKMAAAHRRKKGAEE